MESEERVIADLRKNVEAAESTIKDLRAEIASLKPEASELDAMRRELNLLREQTAVLKPQVERLEQTSQKETAQWIQNPPTLISGFESSPASPTSAIDLPIQAEERSSTPAFPGQSETNSLSPQLSPERRQPEEASPPPVLYIPTSDDMSPFLPPSYLQIESPWSGLLASPTPPAEMAQETGTSPARVGSPAPPSPSPITPPVSEPTPVSGPQASPASSSQSSDDDVQIVSPPTSGPVATPASSSQSSDDDVLIVSPPTTRAVVPPTAVVATDHVLRWREQFATAYKTYAEAASLILENTPFLLDFCFYTLRDTSGEWPQIPIKFLNGENVVMLTPKSSWVPSQRVWALQFIGAIDGAAWAASNNHGLSDPEYNSILRESRQLWIFRPTDPLTKITDIVTEDPTHPIVPLVHRVYLTGRKTLLVPGKRDLLIKTGADGIYYLENVRSNKDLSNTGYDMLENAEKQAEPALNELKLAMKNNPTGLTEIERGWALLLVAASEMGNVKMNRVLRSMLYYIGDPNKLVQ